MWLNIVGIELLIIKALRRAWHRYRVHKSPDMRYVEHKLVKNTPRSHHVKRDDTQVPPTCKKAEEQAISRHPVWLDLSFIKRLLFRGVCRIKLIISHEIV
jgi:hypothetical protein